MHYYRRELTKASIVKDCRVLSVDNTISAEFLSKIKDFADIITNAEDNRIINNIQTLITLFTKATSFVIFPTVYQAFPASYDVCCELRNRIRNFILFHRNITSLTSITYLPTDWDGISPQTTLPSTDYYFFDESTYNAMIQIKDSITYPNILTNYQKPITITYNAGFTNLLNMNIDIINFLSNAIKMMWNDTCIDCNTAFNDPINKAIIYNYLSNKMLYNTEAFYVNNARGVYIS